MLRIFSSLALFALLAGCAPGRIQIATVVSVDKAAAGARCSAEADRLDLQGARNLAFQTDCKRRIARRRSP